MVASRTSSLPVTATYRSGEWQIINTPADVPLILPDPSVYSVLDMSPETPPTPSPVRRAPRPLPVVDPGPDPDAEPAADADANQLPWLIPPVSPTFVLVPRSSILACTRPPSLPHVHVQFRDDPIPEPEEPPSPPLPTIPLQASPPCPLPPRPAASAGPSLANSPAASMLISPPTPNIPNRPHSVANVAVSASADERDAPADEDPDE
jgi:hypothetical protein